MELLVHKIRDFNNFYDWALSVADTRVKDWFLMQGYSPSIALTLLYIAITVVGPKLMESREPFHLKSLLVVYNFFMVALNFHIFSEVLTASWKLNYSYSCQPVDYNSPDPDELRIAKAIWWFYFSKLVEFLDTFFFILRKKNNQVSFLHVYHHATMFPLWWIGVKWVPGGQSFFGAMVNSFVHILMYTYYGLSACGPRIQKYLWWKKYLTVLQLMQFITGGIHAVQSLYVECTFPIWMQYTLVFYACSLFILFLNFYFFTYIIPTRKKQHGKSTSNVSDLKQRNLDEPYKNGVIKNEENGETTTVDKSSVANGDVRKRNQNLDIADAK